MKIGIIGLGFVGLSFASVLASKKYSVIGVDSDKQKISKILTGNAPFYEPKLNETLKIGLENDLKINTEINPIVDECKLIFITVGTPQRENGSIDLTMIKKVVKQIGVSLAKTNNIPIIIIKSTVIPETINKIILPILEKESTKKNGKDFGLISNPEFLQESSAIKNTEYPHVVVLGGEQNKFMKNTKKFFEKLHPNVPIIITNYQTAEMIKYANNSFLATKISFINQLSNICQKIPGANIDDIAETIGLDPRIGKLFLNAGPGYGGSCLPKDMKALINFANTSGIEPTLLNAVEKVNTKQLEQIISISKHKLGNLASKKITILGTAFKPNTDDIRDSIAIELIKKLLKMKAKIIIHDPKAMKNTKKIFKDKINYAETITDALSKSQCVIIMTQWEEYRKLNNNQFNYMKKKFVIDCRRMLVEKQLDIDYFAIGLGKEK